MSKKLKWMLITANPEIALYAESSGVQRIFIDMEVLGKAERQGHLDTHRAAHTFKDIECVCSVLTSCEVMVRLNPLNKNSKKEVDQAIECGAQRLMLPMFTCVEEVRNFKKIVAGRIPVTFLAETAPSLVRLSDWVPLLDNDDEVHFGLNDLSIDMGLDFLFEPLAARLFDYAAYLLNKLNIPFGIGGIARANTGFIPANRILAENIRLGCSRLILSRAFHGSARSLDELKSNIDLFKEINNLHLVEQRWQQAVEQDFSDNYQILSKLIFDKARTIRAAN